MHGANYLLLRTPTPRTLHDRLPADVTGVRQRHTSHTSLALYVVSLTLVQCLVFLVGCYSLGLVAGCNIGCKILFLGIGTGDRFICETGLSIAVNQSKTGPPSTLLAEQGKSGSCSACPIDIFWWIDLQLAKGPVVMLHAELLPPNQGGGLVKPEFSFTLVALVNF